MPDNILDRVAAGRDSADARAGAGLARRPTVERAIARHFRDGESNRIVVVTGDPGDGKTSFLVSIFSGGREVIDDVFGRGAVVHAHWCIRNDETTRQDGRLVDEWSATLASAIPAFAAAVRGSVGHAQEYQFSRWERLVLEPLSAARASGFSSPVVLVVDALDEAIAEPEKPSHNPIAALLRSIVAHLPSDTHIVCTTRIESPLGAGTLHVSLRDQEHSVAVTDWLRARIGAALDGVVGPDRVARAQQDAVDRCQQNFLVARSLARAIVDEVEDAAASGAEPSLDSAAWPDSIAEAFRSDVDRLAEDREARRLVNLVAVAQDGGLPERLLRELLFADSRFPEEELAAVISRARYYLVQGQGERRTLQLFHDAFASFVRDLPQGTASAGDAQPLKTGPLAHKAIASLLDDRDFSWLEADRYLIVAAVTHLAAAARGLPPEDGRKLVQKLAGVCFDIEWIERRVIHSGPSELLADLLLAKEVGVTDPPDWLIERSKRNNAAT